MGKMLDKNFRVVTDGFKYCPKCRQNLSLENWSKSKNTSYCKSCWRERTAEYRKTHKKVVLENTRKSWHKNKDKYNKNRRVGSSVFDYFNKLQNGLCAICERPETSTYKQLCVDHCHITGKYRGLLCNNCNRAIGLLGENIFRLENAILYLERHNDK